MSQVMPEWYGKSGSPSRYQIDRAYSCWWSPPNTCSSSRVPDLFLLLRVLLLAFPFPSSNSSLSLLLHLRISPNPSLASTFCPKNSLFHFLPIFFCPMSSRSTRVQAYGPIIGFKSILDFPDVGNGYLVGWRDNQSCSTFNLVNHHCDIESIIPSRNYQTRWLLEHGISTYNWGIEDLSTRHWIKVWTCNVTCIKQL